MSEPFLYTLQALALLVLVRNELVRRIWNRRYTEVIAFSDTASLEVFGPLVDEYMANTHFRMVTDLTKWKYAHFYKPLPAMPAATLEQS